MFMYEYESGFLVLSDTPPEDIPYICVPSNFSFKAGFEYRINYETQTYDEIISPDAILDEPDKSEYKNEVIALIREAINDV